MFWGHCRAVLASCAVFQAWQVWQVAWQLIAKSVPPRLTGLMWSTSVAWVVQRGPRIWHVWLSRCRTYALVRLHALVPVRPADAVRGLEDHPLTLCWGQRVSPCTSSVQSLWEQTLGARGMAISGQLQSCALLLLLHHIGGADRPVEIDGVVHMLACAGFSVWYPGVVPFTVGRDIGFTIEDVQHIGGTG